MQKHEETVITAEEIRRNRLILVSGIGVVVIGAYVAWSKIRRKKTVSTHDKSASSERKSANPANRIATLHTVAVNKGDDSSNNGPAPAGATKPSNTRASLSGGDQLSREEVRQKRIERFARQGSSSSNNENAR